eukprot:1612798-Rhodomonas_salina.1
MVFEKAKTFWFPHTGEPFLCRFTKAHSRKPPWVCGLTKLWFPKFREHVDVVMLYSGEDARDITHDRVVKRFDL